MKIKVRYRDTLKAKEPKLAEFVYDVMGENIRNYEFMLVAAYNGSLDMAYTNIDSIFNKRKLKTKAKPTVRSTLGLDNNISHGEFTTAFISEANTRGEPVRGFKISENADYMDKYTRLKALRI